VREITYWHKQTTRRRKRRRRTTTSTTTNINNNINNNNNNNNNNNHINNQQEEEEKKKNKNININNNNKQTNKHQQHQQHQHQQHHQQQQPPPTRGRRGARGRRRAGGGEADDDDATDIFRVESRQDVDRAWVGGVPSRTFAAELREHPSAPERSRHGYVSIRVRQNVRGIVTWASRVHEGAREAIRTCAWRGGRSAETPLVLFESLPSNQYINET
jgi:hypothetical protein